jgi:amino acid adenylation domain-containing protein
MADSTSPQDRLAGLSREQRALLFEQIRRRKEKERAAAPPEGIPRRPPGLEPLPLSFAQERLWFIDRLQPGLSTYNMPMALLIAGETSPAALAALLGEVVRRHEVLRTTFREAEGTPAQVIAPAGHWILPLVDLSALPAELRAAEARVLAQEESGRPFDLARGPLLRAALLRLAPAEHALLLTLHHIASDGWSMGVLVREITSLYGAVRAGTPSPLPELPIQYADFAVWQRGWLRGEALERQLAYWREQLAGVPATLDLPTDRPLPPVRTYAGAQLRVDLAAGFAGELARFARRHEATPFMVLLAAFQALLSRITGQEDLAVGSPIANRNRGEIEPLIGFFVNTLVLRGDLSGDPSFHDLLARVRKTTLGAYAHQDLPFEHLVQELRPERHLAANPLFRVLFAVQNAPIGAVELPGLSLSPLAFEMKMALFDLELSFADFGGGMTADISYSTELFDRPTVRRLAAHLETLLREVMADAGGRISAAPLLSQEERQQIVREWNDTEAAMTGAVTGALLAHEIVARQAERTPDAIAVEHEDELLSYRELVAGARRLAGILRAAGVGPDVPVGLWIGRSLALPVSVLAILEAGGACLPLDPTYPAERLALMIGDARPRLVLAGEAALADLPPGLLDGVEVAVLDRRGEIVSGSARPEPPARAPIEPGPESLAYILYTSGSTGRPKGVALPHRALVNMVAWACQARPDRGLRVLQFSPLSFDVSFEELFSTWASGGTLVLMPDELRRDPAALLSLLVERRIERLFQPFVALQQLAEVAREQGGAPAALRELITAGEQLRITPAVAGLFQRGARLFNEYGPTETHVATAFLLQGPPDRWPALPPIGRPIANHRIHLLDRGRQAVPVGVPGELCVGGAGLARGYFGRPDLTADRFLPDPSGMEAGARLYRTGDLARWLPGGDLEYLGRTDFQIKVRGYRVEPGEVEAAVAAHPNVRDAAVVARQDPPGGPRLVAYVVWDGEGGAEAGLREALKARLPAPMIPAAVVALAALPLTPSGKLDRRALAGPAFAPQGAEAAAGYVEPATETEREIAAIWSEVLGVDRVGARDDFFDLGGHSLMAVQILSRMRARLGVDLPVRVLFEAPRLADLAWRADAAQSNAGPPPAMTRRWLTEAPLSFAQTRLWFLDRLEPESSTYTLPFALRMRGELSPAALAAALGEVVRRHEALRTIFGERGGEPVQIIAPVRRWTLPLADLGALPGEAREAEAWRLAGAEISRPFDLGRGPLLRASLLRLGAAEHILLLNVHHIVADGWSLGVLVREITALYETVLAGAPSPLPELPIQYADFSVWQRSWLQGEELRRQISYWRARLAGSPAILELPADRPRPAAPTRQVGRVLTVLTPDLSRQLARFAQTHESSLFMLLLTGLQGLLWRLTGQEDIPVGSPIANRNRAEIEPLIGFFVNTLVLRGDVAGDPAFSGLLARVRQSTLEAYAHQDLPFELLVEELRPQRHLSASPLFQVLCTMQNTPAGSMDLPGLSFAPLEFKPSSTQFDLELNAWDQQGSLAFSLSYSTELFDGATARRLADSLEMLLRGGAAGDGRPLSALPLLPEAARHQIVVEWNDTRTAGTPRSALERFAAQVAATPDAVALEAGGESLTYAELDRRANRLAHRLRRLGVGEGEAVGLFAERSPELVIGLLAVWKAGGSYLPLDPAYPPSRLAYLLEDSRAPVIALGAGLVQALPPGPARIVRLDDGPEDGLEDALEAESDLPPAGGPGPGDLAYRIYTSGTTGRPKAVLVEHGALAGTLAAAHQAFGFRPGDRMPCLASFSFDIFLFELMAPLLAGGTSVLLPLRPTLDLERLLGELGSATHLHAVPAVMRQVLELARRRKVAAPRLRALFTGGDVVPADLLADLRETFPRAAVWELYGPTETAILCASWRVPAEGAVRSLLGRPLAGAEIHVRDAAGSPVPIGVAGEIWIGGGGVARGYWRRDELTAEKFVVAEGRRFFRSGDRARHLPDGNLEFLGRADQQVKVRGFRIETGEVEAALLRHPGLKAAVVTSREVIPGAGGQLVAYVVPRAGDGAAAPPELRSFLEAELPDYMVPSHFVVLDDLPLTLHGKVDRAALPAPDLQPTGAGSGEPPRTPAEEAMADLWRGVLGLDQVGREDNFFALGGHSLLVTQLVARAREAFGVEMPLRAIFETPTVAALARWIEPAMEAGRAPARSSVKGAPPLVPRPAGEPAPLSFGQERLWFLDRMEPGNTAFNMGSSLRLRGRLDARSLERAVNEIVRRHEALRATFGEVDGRPVQRALPGLWVPLSLIDLSALPEAVREVETGLVARASLTSPFDLEAGPLIRTSLLRLAPDLHVFVLDVHHIVTDGWSAGVMDRELIALYDAFTAGKPSPLAPLPIQYGDFARWQREWLTGDTLESQLAYWRGKLGGDLAPLDLPTDHPRPALQTFRGGSLPLAIPEAAGRALRALAREQGASLFMTLLAAFQVLLSRLSGQDDIVVGSPIAGRRHLETEPLIGFFLNTLALRTDLGGNPSFRELLDRVRETTLGAYEHQDIPFEALLVDLKPERDLSRTPLFQVFFNMLSLPPGKTRVEDLEIDPGPAPEAESKFDLTLYVVEAMEAVHGTLVYNADLFDAPRMEELLRQYRAVLEWAARNPDGRIREVSLLTLRAAAVLPNPAQPLGADWRGGVHELFLAAARRHPERPAVVDPHGTWTYGELAAAAGRLAAHLRAAGVAPGDRVAIWAHRSAPVAWAVLGTLAAGGAFVMLDPAYPPARLVEILRLAEPRAWLELAAAGAPPPEVEELLAGWEAEGGLRGRAVLPGGGPEGAASLLAALPAAGEPAATGPDDLAFVAFTSGSTGTPKGILGRHGPLSHFLPWQRERFGLAETDRYSLLSGLAHDPLQRDLFTALATGATLYAPDPEEIFIPGRLAAWAARQGITVAHLTPALGQVLTEPPGDGTAATPIPSLRYVLLVGDVLTRLDVDRLRRLAPGVTCVNLYGSTETQRAVGYHVVDAEAGGAGQRARQVLPLGRGMEDVQILIVNAAERLAGIGEVGEIWMRSPHLARGYLGDEALTRERFRVNPFTGDERDRVYRTGDLGRYLPDGEAVFAGRADQQVKIRGFRIEPGEIQATIGRLEGVRESVVVVREERGDRYLAAYVVPEPGAEPDLAARLPDYMVPAAFVELPALPLTPNGKVDRRALPAPQRQAAGTAAPRGPVEERLATLWADLLRLDRVGAHDNFFELGGHSLLATQLVSRVRGAFQVELPLRVIFEAPTVADLAAWIERAVRIAGGLSVAPPIARAPRDRPLPLSFAQERLWFLQLLAPASPVYNMMAAVRLAGRLDAGALAATLSEILRRHEALRTTFLTTATGAVQEIHPAAPLPQPVVDLSALPAAVRPGEARRISEAEGARPFDLERGPLLRSLLLRLADEDHVALWSTHHINADGWSLSAVFVPELTRLYTAFVQGRPSPLPELPVQYADYAVWQREWLRGPVLAEQLGYWRRQLAGLAPLELPADRPRPPAPSGRGGSRSWELPADLVARLGGLARAGDATLFMALFAAFAAVLHRETGETGLPVGMPVASRSRTEIEGLIGFFVNTLVLRGDLAGDPDLPALLAHSRDTVLGALSHQDIPFERLVDELGLPRNPHRPPLLRVTFQLLTAPADGYLELPGLTLVPFETAVEAAKFDLVVNLYEAAAGIFGVFHYDADLFDAATIARLAGHFTTLLAGWIDEPRRRLGDLPLLTAAERHQLLVEWNPGPAAPDPGRSCLHDLFETQVDRAPEATALSLNGERLTYGELDRRANRLARHLQAAGVRPGDRVALLLERSAEMVAAILAVLKAGAAYVPLDPAYPAERLAFTLEDSGASLLIIEGETEKELAASAVGNVRAIRLDAERDEIARRGGERLDRLEMPLDPDLPAYVIYTSGSTGRPKGVVVTHASVHRLFTATAPWFGFGADDVWTLFHSYAFDFSVWEIWGALLHGGRLVVVPYWESRSPEDFYRLLREERVTVLNQTPSAFRQLLWAEEAVLGAAAPDLALRWVIFGGEALEPASLAPWFARHGDESPRLINMYGITETTVHVTYRPVRAADLAGGSLIGEPIPDLAVHLLDGSLQPLPAGVPGEMHVGGAGLAQGYLGRPDLTAERFVPDPFAMAPGARLYRSGDLARRLPDGDLEYLGRIDQQVKIRGFRIELGEIEAALAVQPGVREAVVLALDGRLVAYLAMAADETGAADAAPLRETLAARLPDYMLPAAFVFLAALPLTENGKVDRRALPAPEAAGAAAQSHVAPRDPLERFLVRQFQEVLGLPAGRETGINEDFFELGGTSITSAIFIHRLQQALSEVVHVVTIFDHPTVASLADFLRERHAEGARRIAEEGGAAAGVAGSALPERGVLVPLQVGSPGRRPLFCVHSVGGEVVSYRDLARLLGAGQPVYGLQSPDPPLQDVREMAARYVAALREVQPSGPYRIAGWSMGGIVAYEMARQLEAAGEKTEVLAVIDAASPARWVGEPGRSDTEMVTLFATALEQLHGGDLDIPPDFELPSMDDLAGLDADAALAIALDLGRRVGLLPSNLELAELRRLFERFQANRRSLASYHGPHSYGGEVQLFRAADPLEMRGDEDPTLGWGKLLNGNLKMFDVPGDHRTVLKVGVEALAGRLRELLR